MSTHRLPVYEIKMREHPNADSLSLMDLPSGNIAVLRTSDWTEGELAVHIEPDYEVDTDQEFFEWMQIKDEQGNRRKRWERVKPMKLRGIRSFGVMIPVRLLPNMDGVVVGDNVLEKVTDIVRRYIPLEHSTSGEAAPGPSGVDAPKYDVESYTYLAQFFEEGEEVVATEKLHGESMRVVCINGEVHVGSRTEWKLDLEGNVFWSAYRNTPELETYVRANEGVVVYGEQYGANPGYNYGTTKNNRRFALFDLFVMGDQGPRWANWDEMEEARKLLPSVPKVYQGPYSMAKMKELAEGKTLMPAENKKDIREGIVVRPIKERVTESGERLATKFVSLEYLSR